MIILGVHIPMKRIFYLTLILLSIWVPFTSGYAASRQPQVQQQTYLLIQIDTVTVAPGDNVTVNIMADIPTGTKLAGIKLDIPYDPTVVQAISCNPGAGFAGICNPTFTSNTAQLNLIASTPLTGFVTLGEVGFHALGVSGQINDLIPISVIALDDKSSSIINISTIKGMVSISSTSPYFISGKVLDSMGKPVSDITIADNAGHRTITDNHGIYTIPRLPGGTYTLKPSAGVSGISFNPAEQTVSVLPSVRDVNFTMDTTFTIGGIVTNDQGKPIAGVTMLDNTGNKAVTDASGNYLFQGVSRGMHTIAAWKAGYDFTPGTRIVSVPPNATGQVFVGVQQGANEVSISGKVVDSLKSPLAGVVLTLSTGQVTTTDTNGNYTMRGVAPGVYTLYAAKNSFIFIPVSRTVSLPRDSSGQDFTGQK